MNPLRDCHLQTHQILKRYARIFARAYYLQPNNVSHVATRRIVPCWDKECETFYRSFTQDTAGTDFDRAASSRLGQKQERRKEAVNSINFLHSSHKTWKTINKLAGRSGRSFHQCLISANSVASQLVKNRAHKTRDHKSTRLVNKELSDLGNIPTPEGHSISEPFRLLP